MSCKLCDERNEAQSGIAYYRWKNANIGVMGCKEHLLEVFAALNIVQKPAQPNDQKRVSACCKSEAYGDICSKCSQPCELVREGEKHAEYCSINPIWGRYPKCDCGAAEREKQKQLIREVLNEKPAEPREEGETNGDTSPRGKEFWKTFDLDKFLEDAKEVGIILERRDSSAPAEPPRPKGVFCANPECDGDFPIVQGGHSHPASITPIFLDTDKLVERIKKGVEDEAWEEEIISIIKLECGYSTLTDFDRLCSWIRAKKSEWEAAAEKKGKESVSSGGFVSEYVCELLIESARADAVREMARELLEIWHTKGYLSVYRFLQEKADD